MLFIVPLAMLALTGYTGADPIVVSTCAVETRHDVSPVEGGDSQITFPLFAGTRLNIKLSNGTDKEASRVTFAVSDGNKVERVVDTGKLSPPSAATASK